MTTTQTAVFETLRNRFHLHSFRAPQREIVNTLLCHRDVLALLPTGAGKSLCYQLPACLLPGITIVVSPLLSLINDQVAKLRNLGITAAALTSQKSSRQQTRIRCTLIKHRIKLLYLSPEKLISKSWFSLLISLPISLVVVDEAHCITMWGSEFRPAYLQIKQYIDALQCHPVVAAFTATATKETAQHITHMLGLTNPLQFQLSTRKPHVQIIVQPCHHQTDKLITLISYLSKPERLPAIVYCATRKATIELAQWLQTHFVPFFPQLHIMAYHGGLSTHQRIEIEHRFISNQTDILVATNAFGMGIDKPNTRTVIHWQVPASIENFYQEIGRAGRDLKPALSVLCFSEHDLHIQQKISMQSNRAKNYHLLKLTYLIQMLKKNSCLNQQLEYYFSDPEHLPTCGRCSNCVPTQPLTNQHFQLAKYFFRTCNSTASELPTPTCVIELLTVLQPTRYELLQCIPGIGVGWLKIFAAQTIIVCKLFCQPVLLTVDKHSTNLGDFLVPTAEPH